MGSFAIAPPERPFDEEEDDVKEDDEEDDDEEEEDDEEELPPDGPFDEDKDDEEKGSCKGRPLQMRPLQCTARCLQKDG